MNITRQSIQPFRSLVLLAALLCFSSCGGGDGAGGGISGPGEVTPHDKYFLLIPGTLDAVDPYAPTQLYSFGSDDVSIFDLVQGGEFNAENQSLLNPGMERLVYANDNRLLSVDLEIERLDGVVQPPVPVELMTFSAAVEAVTVEEDHSPGGAPTYVVRLASGFEVFTEQAGVPTLPLAFPGTPEISLLDPTTGAFLGWLAVDAGSLIRVDRELNIEFLASADEVEKLGDTSDIFLAMDGKLMSFDVATGALVDIGYELETDWVYSYRQVTAGTLYFEVVDGIDGDQELYRTDADGPVSILGAWDASVSFGPMAVLETRRVYRTYAHVGGPPRWNLHSVELEGTASDTFNHGWMCSIGLAFGDSVIHGDSVFYYVHDQIQDRHLAYAMNADGSGRTEREHGHWLAPQLENELFLNRAREAERLFWLDDNSATLTAVDPADPGGTLHALGGLAPGVSTFVLGSSYGDSHLGLGYEGDDTTGPFDVFFFSSSEAGSLIQVSGPPMLRVPE